MSQENVEVVRQTFEDFNAFMRGDMSSDAYAECFDPQIELHWRDQRTYPDTPQDLRASRSSSRSLSSIGTDGSIWSRSRLS